MNLTQLAETGHLTKVFDPDRTIPVPGAFASLLSGPRRLER